MGPVEKIRGPGEFLGARKYGLGAREKIEIPLCPFSTLTTGARQPRNIAYAIL